MKTKSSKANGASRRPLPIDWSAATRFKVPIPKDEPERIADLVSYEVLDSPPDDDLDQITLLASHICETPIALITLIDSDRQWFKSKVGITLSETSRDVAFCAHAIMQHELFIVPDALKDRRFSRNPLVTSSPSIRFYAGAPLVSPDRHVLGTLCVIDRVPRKLTADQENALRALSKLVITHLNLHRQLETQRAALRERDVERRKSCLASRELRTLATTVVAATNRALAGSCTIAQRRLLHNVRSSAGGLLSLSSEIAKVSQKPALRR